MGGRGKWKNVGLKGTRKGHRNIKWDFLFVAAMRGSDGVNERVGGVNLKSRKAASKQRRDRMKQKRKKERTPG